MESLLGKRAFRTAKDKEDGVIIYQPVADSWRPQYILWKNWLCSFKFGQNILSFDQNKNNRRTLFSWKTIGWNNLLYPNIRRNTDLKFVGDLKFIISFVVKNEAWNSTIT